MKEKKTELRIFTIADWEKEEQYLRKRHRKGWRFVKVGLLGVYHFEKCTPEDVVYQLDYDAKGVLGPVFSASYRSCSACCLFVDSRIFRLSLLEIKKTAEKMIL